jgi:hypothetical protein
MTVLRVEVLELRLATVFSLFSEACHSRVQQNCSKKAIFGLFVAFRAWIRIGVSGQAPETVG